MSPRFNGARRDGIVERVDTEELATFVPSALLFAAGWRLLQQDAAVREQEARERRERWRFDSRT
jgi:hypothetical protein